MSRTPAPRERDAAALTTPQSTSVEFRLGEHVRLAARTEISSTGLLAVGAMVSMILLSSAAIVRAARIRRG